MAKNSLKSTTIEPEHLSKKEKLKLKNKLEKLKENKRNEDAKWLETDKNVLNKQVRKEEKDLKKIQNDERKRQLKLLAEKEMEEIENNQKKTKKQTVPRMTAAQISHYQQTTGNGIFSRGNNSLNSEEEIENCNFFNNI